jgi:hypothetical protein
VHRGRSLEIVFVTERGFAVPADTEPFASFNIWKPETFMPNDLAPLRPAIAAAIHGTFSACNEFVKIVSETIGVPKAAVPEMHLFVRGTHVNEILRIPNIIEKCLWWDED